MLSLMAGLDCEGEGRGAAFDEAGAGDVVLTVFVVSGDVFVAEFMRTSGALLASVVCETVLRLAVKGRRKVGGRVQGLSRQARLICRESIVVMVKVCRYSAVCCWSGDGADGYCTISKSRMDPGLRRCQDVYFCRNSQLMPRLCTGHIFSAFSRISRPTLNLSPL